MKNFIFCMKKVNILVLIFFLSHFVSAMDEPERQIFIKPERDYSQPQKTFTFFDPKQAVEMGKKWKDIAFESVEFTPDNKSVVMGRSGQIWWAPLDEIHNVPPKCIIEHVCAEGVPMIAMVQNKDSGLMVVSAVNYVQKGTGKCVSEYIVYEKQRDTCKTTKLDSTIQAIMLNSEGDKIIVANEYAIAAYNLKNGHKYSHVSCMPRSRDNWIQCFVRPPDGCNDSIMVAIGSKSGMQLMRYSESKDDLFFVNLRQVSTSDIIRKIHNPRVEDLLLLTHDGCVKKLNIYKLLEPDVKKSVRLTDQGEIGSGDEGHAELNSEEKNEIIFSYSKERDCVVIDPTACMATAHWCCNEKQSKEVRREIEIYHQGAQNIVEKFILKVPLLEERYEYITEENKKRIGIGRILLLALRGKNIIGIGTDGKARLWSLPPAMCSAELIDNSCKDMRPYEGPDLLAFQAVSVSLERLSGRDAIIPIGEGRRRSASGSPIAKNDQQSSDGSKLTKKKKPSSSSLLKLLKFSRESSPTESPPTTSPRGKPEADLKESDEQLS